MKLLLFVHPSSSDLLLELLDTLLDLAHGLGSTLMLTVLASHLLGH